MCPNGSWRQAGIKGSQITLIKGLRRYESFRAISRK